MEDAYSFASSFTYRRKNTKSILDSSPSKEEDLRLLPTEL